MSLPPSGFKPAQTGLVDMGVISFYDLAGTNPTFNVWELAPYKGSFSEIVLNLTWAQLQPSEGTAPTTSLIDNAINQVLAFNAAYGTNVGIKLRVWGGFDAPEWVKNLDGDPLTITGQKTVDPNVYANETLGRFWSGDYAYAWQSFQGALANLYDGNPVMRGISQTLGAAATDEPFVPLLQSAPLQGGGFVNQLAQLEAGGYRDAAEMLTLRAAVASYAQWSTTPLDYTMNAFHLLDAGTEQNGGNFTLAVLQQARNSARIVQAGNHALRSPLYPPDDLVYGQLANDAALIPSPVPNSFQTASPDLLADYAGWLAAIVAGVGLNAGNIELWDFSGPPGLSNGFQSFSPAQVQALASILASGSPPPTTNAPDNSQPLGFIAPAYAPGTTGTVAFTGTSAVLLASVTPFSSFAVSLTSLGGGTLGFNLNGVVLGASQSGNTLSFSGSLAQVNTLLANLTDTLSSGASTDVVHIVAVDSNGDIAARDVGVQIVPASPSPVPTAGLLPANQFIAVGTSSVQVVGQGQTSGYDVASQLGSSGVLVLGGVQSSYSVSGGLTLGNDTTLLAALSPASYSTASLTIGGALAIGSNANAYFTGALTAASIGSSGGIHGDGTLTATGGGAITNLGTIEAVADLTLGLQRLTVNNSIVGTGTLLIDPGATLSLRGAVASSQTIKLALPSVAQLANGPYSPSVLVLQQPSQAQNVTIDSLTFADRLILDNVTVTGASITGTVLTVTTTTGTLTYNVADTGGVAGLVATITGGNTIAWVASSTSTPPTISAPTDIRASTSMAVGVPDVVISMPLPATTPSNLNLTVTLTAPGVLAVTAPYGATVTGDNHTLTLVGTLDAVERSLQSLTYKAKGVAGETIKIDASDYASVAATQVSISVDTAAAANFVWPTATATGVFSTGWGSEAPGGADLATFNPGSAGHYTVSGDGAVGEIDVNATLTLTGRIAAQGLGNLALHVDRAGTLVLAGGAVLTAGKQAIVGDTSQGMLALMGGALALTDVVPTDNVLVIGQQSGSTGTVLNLEQIAGNGQVVVGKAGSGTLELLGVAATVLDGGASVGQSAGSHGSVIVNGGEWTNAGLLTVGDQGIGSLLINGMKNGITGQTTAYDATIGNQAGSQGSVSLDGGELLVANIFSATSTLLVGGAGSGSLTIENGSEVAVGAAQGQLANNTGTLAVGGAGSGLVRVGGYSSLLVYGDALIGGQTNTGTVIVGEIPGDTALFALNDTLTVNSTGHVVLGGAHATVRAATIDIAPGGLVSGAGTLSGDGGGSHTVGLANIYNDGTIQAVGGQLLVYGPVEGAGTLAVTSGSSMTLQASVGGNETLALSAKALVTLNDPHAFHGTITGMEQGDVLDLASTQVSNSYWTNGVLGLTTPDGPLLIKVLGSYGAHSFTVTPDGLGGTNIGVGQGDVHMTSFDGLHYEFQAVGEFVAAQSTVPGNRWEVQIRADGVQGQMSFATEVVADFGGVHVTFAIGRGSLIQVNGAPDMELAPGWAQNFGGVTLAQTSNNSYMLIGSDGQSIAITAHVDHLDFSVALGAHNVAGSVQGLLGSHSGPGKDFQLPDGTVLPQPLTDEEIVGHFADAWRVGAEHHSIL